MKPHALQRTATLAVSLLLAHAAHAVEAAKPTPTSAPAAVASAGPVHPALGITLPVSAFVNDPASGRDPFYPGSTRRVVVAKVHDKTPVAPSVDRSNLLTLLGVTGPTNRRIALINNQTFVAGDEGIVRTSAGTLKLQVVEVGEKSVRVVIEGDAAARELKLKEANSNGIQIQTSKIDNK